jgi:hypothetical protein
MAEGRRSGVPPRMRPWSLGGYGVCGRPEPDTGTSPLRSRRSQRELGALRRLAGTRTERLSTWHVATLLASHAHLEGSSLWIAHTQHDHARMLRGNDPSDRDNALQLLDRALITANSSTSRRSPTRHEHSSARWRGLSLRWLSSDPHSSAFTRPTTGYDTALPTLRLQRGTRGLLAAIGTQCDHHALRIGRLGCRCRCDPLRRLVKNHLPGLINVALAMLARTSLELPAFSTRRRLGSAAR